MSEPSGPIFIVRNADGVAFVDVHAQDCENPPTAAEVEAIRVAAQAEFDAQRALYRDQRAEEARKRLVDEVVGRVLGRKTPTYDPPPPSNRLGREWVFRDKLKAEKAKRLRRKRRTF